jgi:hypothetical protein
LVRFIKEGKANVYFYPQGTSAYYLDLMNCPIFSKKTVNTIAGKSIYGIEFSYGNENFGRENVQVLLQTDSSLDVRTQNGDIFIDPDELGHVTYNPNLLGVEELNFTDNYRPILYCRFTKKEVFRWVDGMGRNIMLGSRFLMMPFGKKTPSAKIIV